MLRQEDRNIEKQIRDITLEQTKVKTAIKAAAKRGDLTNCKVSAPGGCFFFCSTFFAWHRRLQRN